MKWFSVDPEFDQQIRDEHMKDYEDIVKDEGESWAKEENGKMGAIFVLDQFSRNMFRKNPKAFAADHISLRLCKEMVESGEIDHLKYLEKTFAILPLEHSENLEDQLKSVELFQKLVDESVEQNKEYSKNCLLFAKSHLYPIQKFGRFPHRNAILGRESTKEEIDFLKSADTYGQ